MRRLAALVSVADLCAFVLSPLRAQEKGEGRKEPPGKPPGPPPEGKRKDGPPEGGERKGPPPQAKNDERPGSKCGKELGPCLDEIKKRKDVNHEALECITKEHFKVFHPDGCCHCECNHKPPPPPREGDKKCGGKDPGGICDEFKKRKDLGGQDVDKCVKEHFRIYHPDGCCHCFCRHHEEGGKEGGPRDGGSKDGGAKDNNRKGNNGVGNGVDPQPPGNPPVNDGAGTGPGNPGNKKGGGGGEGGRK